MGKQRKAEGGSLTAPPWGDPRDWRQVNGWLRYWIERRRSRMQPALDAARGTAGTFRELFVALDTLCAATCRHCPEPCCLTAHPWYDFADLLLLNLLAESIPLRQILVTADRPCPHFGRRGCRLPRRQRPFICTWYLCPTQRRRGPQARLNSLAAAIESVKTQRRRMETAWVQAVR